LFVPSEAPSLHLLVTCNPGFGNAYRFFGAPPYLMG
jgi:hypothetical protein